MDPEIVEVHRKPRFLLGKLWHYLPIKYENRNGKRGNIISYDGDFLLRFGFILPFRGSVFTMNQLFTVVATGGVSVFMGIHSCDSKRTSSCFPVPKPSPSLLTLASICSFLLAIFTNILLSRWWAMRGHICTLEGASSDVLMHVVELSMGAIRAAKSVDEKKRMAKQSSILLRKIGGLVLLVLMTLFKNQKPKMERLVAEGYVTEADYSQLVDMKASPVDCCFIIGTLLQDAAYDGLLGEGGTKTSSFSLLLNDLSSIRQQCAELDKCVNCQIPYPLVQMIVIVVYGFIAQLVYVGAGFIAAGMNVTGLLTVCISSFVVIGALKVFVLVSDPFGDDAADFPGNYYCDKFEQHMLAVRNNYSQVSMSTSMFHFEDRREIEKDIGEFECRSPSRVDA